MANDTDLLDQIRKVVREENEPLFKRLDELEQGQEQIRDAMATKSDLARTDTAVDAVKAGVEDIQGKMATKADVLDLGSKIDKVTKGHETRIRELEEDRGIRHRDKN